MFKSAASRLTIGYLAIIMALSIGCSFVIYHVGSTELANNSRRPVDIYNALFGPNNGDVALTRQTQLDEDRAVLKIDLILFNLGVLVVGGAVSYILAKRTLHPIENALEMQKRFTGDASHELRTPLTAMQSEIEVALRDSKLSQKEAVGLLKSNLEEVVKLKELSEGLLTLATSGRAGDSERINLKQLADETRDSLFKQAAKKNINISNKVNSTYVNGDRAQLHNLLNILVNNAVKYSSRNQTVTIKSSVRDNNVLVQVVDNGIGIAPKDLPHIFERFYRADTSRASGDRGGHGLGLAIAEKITSLHGGHLSAQSKPGKGSIFTLSLPKA